MQTGASHLRLSAGHSFFLPQIPQIYAETFLCKPALHICVCRRDTLFFSRRSRRFTQKLSYANRRFTSAFVGGALFFSRRFTQHLSPPNPAHQFCVCLRGLRDKLFSPADPADSRSIFPLQTPRINSAFVCEVCGTNFFLLPIPLIHAETFLCKPRTSSFVGGTHFYPSAVFAESLPYVPYKSVFIEFPAGYFFAARFAIYAARPPLPYRGIPSGLFQVPRNRHRP